MDEGEEEEEEDEEEEECVAAEEAKENGGGRKRRGRSGDGSRRMPLPTSSPPFPGRRVERRGESRRGE